MRGDITKPIEQRWALIVGINDYYDPQVSELNFCVDDALSLAKLLVNGGYQVKCMHDRRERDDHLYPTRENIEAEIRGLCSNAGINDLVLVHFSCHGIREHNQAYLLAQDTRITNLRSDPTRGLSLEFIESELRKSPARRCVMFLDACHTGVEMGRSVEDDREFMRNAYELAEGFALLAGSTSQQKAWEDGQHGVFTAHLLSGLRGKADRDHKGFVTVDNLKKHVINGVKRWTFDKGLVQEPTARTDGIGDMILMDVTDSSKLEEVSQQRTERSKITPTNRNSSPSREAPLNLAIELERNHIKRQIEAKKRQYQLTSSAIEEGLDPITNDTHERRLERLLAEIKDLENKLL